MAEVAPAMSHSPPDAPRRPKGILKNSNSFQHASPDAHVSPLSEHAPNPAAVDGSPAARPPMAERNMSEREIVQMNTELNAGGQRRGSSSARGSLLRRQSDLANDMNGDEVGPNGQRLKWDEANLYLNEGQMGGKMKIDEPKTPFVGQYEPSEDEDEVQTLDPQEIVVDELEKHQLKQAKKAKDSDIPGLDLGEPEMEPIKRRESDGERRVLVDSDPMDVDGGKHGEEKEEDMSREELEKHRKFEQMRKKHYEMKNIKNLLGHDPDELASLDDAN